MKEGIEVGLYHLGIALSVFVTDFFYDPIEEAGFWSPGYKEEIDPNEGYIRLEPAYAWDELDDGSHDFLVKIVNEPAEAVKELFAIYHDEITEKISEHIKNNKEDF